MSAQPSTAKVGDVIVCRAVSPPYINPLRVIRTKLENAKQVAYANRLLSDPKSGFQLEPPTPTEG